MSRNTDVNALQSANYAYNQVPNDESNAFLGEEGAHEMTDLIRWKLAADFVDSLVLKRPKPSRFDSMTKAEIKMDRLKSRRLIVDSAGCGSTSRPLDHAREAAETFFERRLSPIGIVL